MRPLVPLVVLVAGVANSRADTLHGTIVDATTRAPVGGAVITIGNELVASDDDGAFTIELPAGDYTLEVTAPWLEPARRKVALHGRVDLVVEVREVAAPAGETIEIVDLAPTAPGETRVDAKVARSVPGGGDAAKVVQSLPAVARAQAGSAEIVVWGAAPRDTRVFVDGVPVTALYHLGGYRAAVGNDLVGDLRLQPAAFGPDRGRAIGGVIDVELADPARAIGDPEASTGWRVQADLLDAALAGRTRAGGVAIAAAGRQSWLDRAIGLVADPETLAPNAPLPRWSDAQVVARSRVSADVVATAWVLAARDALDRRLGSIAAGGETVDPATEVAQHVIQSTVRAQVTLRRERPTGFDSATVWFGHDRASDDLAVGLIPANQRTVMWVGGARAAQQSRLWERAPGADDRSTLLLGLDLDGEQAAYRRTGSLTIPAREGDLHIFGQPPGDDVGADRWFATTLDGAAYAAVDLHVGRVTATLGARGDAWVLGASRLTPKIGTTPAIGSQQIELTADPRASVAVRLTDRWTARVDGGRYHQARAGSDTSAVFGTPDLALEQAWHAIAGAQWRPARAPVAIEAAAYARRLDTLVARDLAVTPLFAQALTQGGTGRVIGAQLTARVVGYHGLTGWLSYAVSRSTRKDADSQPERLFDHDQTHGLIAVAGWERGPWTLGGRVRVSTGEPRTDVVGAFFDSRSGRFQPMRGTHNGTRLPVYFAADLRVQRELGGSPRTTAYLEVQNLTNHSNAEEIIYSADFSRRDYLTGLPALAIAGVRLER